MFFKQVDMPVKAGVNYRVSLDYMINSLDGSSIKVRIESVDSKGQIKSTDMNLPKNDTWENFNFDIVAGADVVKFNLIIVSPSNTSSDISLDNVSITYNDNSVNSIQMDTTPIKLREGAFTFLNAIALPETADNRKLHYSSDDEAGASDSGAEVVPPTGVQSNTYILVAILGTSLLTLLRLKRKKLKI